MILTEHLKSIAGRWMDRNILPPQLMAPLPQPLPVHEVDDEQPHSTPRAAMTLCKGEHVWTASRWREIERVAVVRKEAMPTLVLLYLVGGGILSSRFDAVYVSRDLDETEMAAKEAVR